jgi:sugar phosphate isomerase/epimerase
MSMKLGLSSVSCPDKSLQGIAADARNYGFDGVELRTATENRHLSIYTPENIAGLISRLFRRDGKPIFSLKCSTRLTVSNCLAAKAEVGQLIALAAQMRVPFVRITLDERSILDELSEAPLLESLNRLAEFAAELGVRVAVETDGPWTSGRLLSELLGCIEAQQGIGVVYNLFNCATSTNDGWEESYTLLRPHICYCRLVDAFVSQDGRAQHCLLGTGELPVRRVLQRLKADAYAGYVSFDWQLMHNPRLDPPEYALPHFVQTMRAIWSSLERATSLQQHEETMDATALR